jgi:hypothetical protein
VIEADELWSFVGDKGDVWWVRAALDAGTRQIVAMVAGEPPEYVFDPPEPRVHLLPAQSRGDHLLQGGAHVSMCNGRRGAFAGE